MDHISNVKADGFLNMDSQRNTTFYLGIISKRVEGVEGRGTYTTKHINISNELIEDSHFDLKSFLEFKTKDRLNEVIPNKEFRFGGWDGERVRYDREGRELLGDVPEEVMYAENNFHQRFFVIVIDKVTA